MFRHLRFSLPAAVLAITLLFLAPVASAALPPIGNPAPPAAPTSAPPSGGMVVEGESLPGATRVVDTTSNGGAYGQFVRASATMQLPAGTYMLTARVKAMKAVRVDLLSADKMVGSYGVGTTWTTIYAKLRINPNDPRVGAGTWVRSGPSPVVLVDWFQLARTADGFTAQGNTLLDANGAVYQMTGFNKSDYADSHVYLGRLQFSKNEADAMAAWGASTVRIGLNQEFWLADCAAWAGTTATTYQSLVKAEVASLTAKGVNVMLSLMVTEHGQNTGCTVTTGMLREMADQRSVTLWSQVANAFKSNPLVMFDLFNEPHDITADQWRNGGTVAYGTYKKQSFVAVGMQALYNTVRGTGAQNAVFVSGLGWASDPRVNLTNPLDGYGISAGSHSYCHECTDADPHPQDLLDTLNDPETRARMPLTMTEFGWPDNSSTTFNRKMIDWSKAHSVGYLVYSWLAPTGTNQPDAYSVVGGGTVDVGGVLTRQPTLSAYPLWNELAPIRVARGFAAMPLPE
jgi:hypothetical protein